MKETISGWVIINLGHTKTGKPCVFSTYFKRTRKDCIQEFVKSSGNDWKYWYRKYKFRCVKATQTVEVVAFRMELKGSSRGQWQQAQNKVSERLIIKKVEE